MTQTFCLESLPFVLERENNLDNVKKPITSFYNSMSSNLLATIKMWEGHRWSKIRQNIGFYDTDTPILDSPPFRGTQIALKVVKLSLDSIWLAP